MINVKQELSNYSPINVESLANAQVSENVRNAALLYNKALESLKNSSEDMAVIELKKAISIYPDFYEAMNLLGLCYMYMKDYAKASSILEQVTLKESNGVKAFRYLSTLNTNEQSAVTPVTRKSRAGLNESGNSFIKDITNIKINWKRDILKYASGLVAGFLIFTLAYFLIFSDGQKSSTVSADAGPLPAVQTKETGKKYDSLKKDYDKLKSDLEAANNEIGYYQNINKLNDVQNLFSQKKYEEAADLLVLLKTTAFKDEDKTKFDELYAEVMPDALWLVEGDGIRLFSTAKYQEAIQKLNKAVLYNNQWEGIDRVYYYIGKSYFALKDSKNALDTFNKIITNFPKSRYAVYSINYINQLPHTP